MEINAIKFSVQWKIKENEILKMKMLKTGKAAVANSITEVKFELNVVAYGMSMEFVW